MPYALEVATLRLTPS